MNKLPIQISGRVFVLLCLMLSLNACAISLSQPWHAFSFDGRFDKWGDKVDLLEYQYGDRYAMTHRSVRPGARGLGDGVSINGPMPVGDFLYVKWRSKATGEIFEDRVDLRGRLASNMEQHRLTFVTDGRQLYVYLVTPAPKHESDPPLLKTTESRYHVTFEIYPANTYKK